MHLNADVEPSLILVHEEGSYVVSGHSSWSVRETVGRLSHYRAVVTADEASARLRFQVSRSVLDSLLSINLFTPSMKPLTH